MHFALRFYIPSARPYAYLIFKGGQLYPVRPSDAWAGYGCSLLPAGDRWYVSCAIVGHCDFVYWFSEGWMQGGGGVMVVVRAYLNNARPDPSSHCGLCTLILCVGTRDPLIHRCVACTKVILILLLTYPQVLE